MLIGLGVVVIVGVVIVALKIVNTRLNLTSSNFQYDEVIKSKIGIAGGRGVWSLPLFSNTHRLFLTPEQTMLSEFFQRKKREFIGKELEETYLGFPIDWKPILAKNKINSENLTRQDWLRIFKEHYPLDPKLPEKKWGKDIFNFTAEKLGLNLEDPKELDFYKAIGSGLDNQGIDCFFLFKNPNTKKGAIFSLDITAQEKKDKWKADMIINEFPDHRFKEGEYIEKMEETAKQIARRLIEKSGPLR